MSKSHQKKRNTGLIYEFLVQEISRALVENDSKRSSVALKILRKHFKPGTSLYREFRLINSLVKTTVSSHAVAASIMQEAKIAARAYDADALDREKSLLIRNINHKLNRDDFYDQHVNEYKVYATIQTLLNDWRTGSIDIEKMAKYEDQLVEWLVSKKPEAPEQFINEESPGAGRLLMKVLMQKLNDKYAGVLNESQKSIVRTYVWSTTNDDPNAIRDKLANVKASLLESIGAFEQQNQSNEFMKKKLNDVRTRVQNEALDGQIDDAMVTRFMLYIKLNEELSNDEEGTVK